MRDEVVETAGDAKAKVNLQSSFYVKEIDSRYPKGHRPSVKKDKDDAYWEQRNGASNKNKEKAKFHNPSSANQLQTQTSKKCQGSWQRGHLATRVNAIMVAKKDKDKTKDLSHVECYTCKQKGHYANKCPEK